MIRLYSLIILLCISTIAGGTEERLVSSHEISLSSQSEKSATYDLFNQYESYVGVIGASANEFNFLPDVRKNLFSGYQIIDEIKSNGFYFTEANLLGLIRKDNFFLSILRI